MCFALTLSARSGTTRNAMRAVRPTNQLKISQCRHAAVGFSEEKKVGAGKIESRMSLIPPKNDPLAAKVR
jgi:hypothetical protein